MSLAYKTNFFFEISRRKRRRGKTIKRRKRKKWRGNNRIAVVVVEGKQEYCGCGGGTVEGKTVEMCWW